MAQFTKLISRVAILPVDNIDTDQIIPARFLKVTDKQGLAQGLFADWRKDDPNFVLNHSDARDCQILVAGDNFGCGSSREHAPWALLAGGLRAIISTSFADIFRNNSLKNGLLPVALNAESYQRLLAISRGNPQLSVTIDLTNEQVTADDFSASFAIDAFAKHCLLGGIDQLEYLLKHHADIEAFEGRRDASK